MSNDQVPINPFLRSDAHVDARPSVTTTVTPVPAVGTPVYTVHSLPRDTNGPAPNTSGNEPWYSRSSKICTISGIEVHVAPLFYIYAGFLMLINAFYGALYFFLAVCEMAILFGTVLVHEFGHCFATRRVGGEVSHILLWPLGGLAYVNLDGTSAKGDLWVAIAGPLTHVPMFFVWFIAFAASAGNTDLMRGTGKFFPELMRSGCWINISLFLFNLFIPAYPLDGSRVLTSLLAMLSVSLKTAGWVVILVSTIMSIALLAFGFIYISFMSVFIGAYTLGETYKLYSLHRLDRLQEHPTFKKYNELTRGGSWTAQAI